MTEYGIELYQSEVNHMRTLRIGFTENGIDDAMLSYAIAKFQDNALVLLVSNGTISAENHIAKFIANLPAEMRGIESVTVVSPPLYALSVESADATLSKPHYVWTTPPETSGSSRTSSHQPSTYT